MYYGIIWQKACVRAWEILDQAIHLFMNQLLAHGDMDHQPRKS